MDSGWSRIFWLYLTGVLAAAQLGKMAALVPLIGHEMALGLTTAALSISLLEIGGASLGLIAGSLIDRIGRHAALSLGLAAIALAGIGEALASGPGLLLGWRVRGECRLSGGGHRRSGAHPPDRDS